jgi:multidrug resistance efflux pump
MNHIVGIGKIIPENDIIQLSSPVNGIVQEIYKTENDTVNAGTIIMELQHDAEDEKIVQLHHEITTQVAQIGVDAASIYEFDAKVRNATLELQRLKRLLAKGAETQQTVDDENTNVKALTSNLRKSKAVVTVAKSRLQEIQSALKMAQIERDQKIIRSPVKGTILELTMLIGGPVAMQQSLAQISPGGKVIAICEIDELNAAKIFAGQNGWVRMVGTSDTLTTGTVYFTSSFLKMKSLFTDQSGEKEDRRVRVIKMQLDKPEQLLMNARVECVIDISKHL